MSIIEDKLIIATTRTTTTIEPELFNIHERWGIAISFLCFIIGFPSNLLAILVCVKSLTSYYYLKSPVIRFLCCCFKRRNSTSGWYKSGTTSSNNNNNSNNNQNNQNVESVEDNNNESNGLVDDAAKRKEAIELRRKTNLQNLIVNKQSHVSRISNPHRRSFEMYLIEISVCDIIILTYHFAEWLTLILSRLEIIDKTLTEPIYISEFMCRFVIALNRTIILLHNWLVATLALTRCYAIYRPINSNTYFSSNFYTRLNLYIVCILTLIFTLANIFGVALLTYTKTPIHSNFTNITDNVTAITNDWQQHTGYLIECKLNQELYNKFKYLDAYLNLAIGVIGYSLPCLITLVINLALIFNLRQLLFYKTNKLRRNNIKRIIVRQQSGSSTKSNTTTPLTSNSKKNQQRTPSERENTDRIKFFKTTSSLLTISLSYLICYLPFTFLFLLLSLDKLNMNVDLIFVVTSLRYINHTINFYIYYATGKRFRNDVNSFLCGSGGNTS